jgi:hypothetical protein
MLLQLNLGLRDLYYVLLTLSRIFAKYWNLASSILHLNGDWQPGRWKRADCGATPLCGKRMRLVSTMT